MNKNHGRPFVMNATGRQIPDYVQRRKDDYARAKERKREVVKVRLTKKRLEKKNRNIFILDSSFKQKGSYE